MAPFVKSRGFQRITRHRDHISWEARMGFWLLHLKGRPRWPRPPCCPVIGVSSSGHHTGISLSDTPKAARAHRWPAATPLRASSQPLSTLCDSERWERGSPSITKTGIPLTKGHVCSSQTFASGSTHHSEPQHLLSSGKSVQRFHSHVTQLPRVTSTFYPCSAETFLPTVARGALSNKQERTLPCGKSHGLSSLSEQARSGSPPGPARPPMSWLPATTWT